MHLLQPFVTEVNFDTGVFTPRRSISQRRLSDMALMYTDRDASRPHPRTRRRPLNL